MTYCRRRSDRHPTPRSAGHTACLVLCLLCLPGAVPAAGDLLEAGSWKGEYEPASLGSYIDATFCVQAHGARTPPWTVTMRLRLDPPGNEPVEFEQMQITGDTLSFRINLLGAWRTCVLAADGQDELNGKCRLAEGSTEKIDTLSMRKTPPAPDDPCRPAAEAPAEPATNAGDAETPAPDPS